MEYFEKNGIQYGNYSAETVHIICCLAPIDSIPTSVEWRGKQKKVTKLISIVSDQTELIIPSDVQIEHDTFRLCPNLLNVKTETGQVIYQDGCQYNSDQTEIMRVLPAVKKLSIPEGVKSISKHAFQNCQIEEISFSTAIFIGEGAFNGCVHLCKVSVPNLDTWLKMIFPNDVYNEQGTNPLFYAKEFIVGNQVIHDLILPQMPIYTNGTFSHYKGLTSVTFVEQANGYHKAFRGCENLTSVTFSKNNQTEYIPSHCFEGCSNLSTFIIPEGVKHIGAYAFYNCKNLRHISIAKSVTSIGICAFDGCNLQQVELFNEKVSIEFGGSTFKILKDKLVKQVVSTSEIEYTMKDNMVAIDKVKFSAPIPKGEFPSQINGAQVGIISSKACSYFHELILPNCVKTLTSSESYDYNACVMSIPDTIQNFESDFFTPRSKNGYIHILANTIIVRDNGGMPDFSLWQFEANKIIKLYLPTRHLVAAAKQYGDTTFKELLPLSALPRDLEYMLHTTPMSELEMHIGDNISLRKDGEVARITSVKEATTGALFIPDSIDNLPIVGFDTNALSGCTKLTEISLPSSIIFMDSIFADCNRLNAIVVRNNDGRKISARHDENAIPLSAVVYVNENSLISFATTFKESFKDYQPLDNLPNEFSHLLSQHREQNKVNISKSKSASALMPEKPEPKPAKEEKPAQKVTEKEVKDEKKIVINNGNFDIQALLKDNDNLPAIQMLPNEKIMCICVNHAAEGELKKFGKDANITEQQYMDILYNATRRSWKAKPEKANECTYVATELHGVCRAVWKTDSKGWHFDPLIPDRIMFEGSAVTDSDVLTRLKDKKLPERANGAANPIRYFGF